MPPARRDSGGIDEDLIERLAPIAAIVRKYCRITVTGTENVPRGKALLVSNHTGWSGLDGVNLVSTIHDELHRAVFIAAHPNFFQWPVVRDLAPRLGFFEAGVRESVRILDRDDLVLFCPEGEAGNFKPFWQLYQLQPFKPGFARVAIAAAAPVAPVVIIGGEEASPAIARLEFTKELIGVGLPLPATLLPLPVKWRISFLPPIPVEKYLSKEMADADPVEALRRDVEATMREAVQRELTARGDPFV